MCSHNIQYYFKTLLLLLRELSGLARTGSALHVRICVALTLIFFLQEMFSRAGGVEAARALQRELFIHSKTD